MTKEIMNTIYNALNTVEFEGKSKALEALWKEMSRGEFVKAQKCALYDQAKEPVLEALRIAGKPATVAEIFAECEKELPDGFTKNQVGYGLTHYWTNSVVKNEGKVNTYQIKEGA